MTCKYITPFPQLSSPFVSSHHLHFCVSVCPNFLLLLGQQSCCIRISFNLITSKSTGNQDFSLPFEGRGDTIQPIPSPKSRINLEICSEIKGLAYCRPSLSLRITREARKNINSFLNASEGTKEMHEVCIRK